MKSDFYEITKQTPENKRAYFKLIIVPRFAKVYGEDLKVGDVFYYYESDKKPFGALVSMRTGKGHMFSQKNIDFIGYK